MSETNARVSVTVGTKADTAPVDRYTASVQRMNSAINRLIIDGGAFRFGAGIAAGAVGLAAMTTTITNAIGGSGQLADEIDKVGRRLGISGEAFQVLSRVGKASTDELIAALATYRRKLGEALSGDGAARKTFSAAGLSPEQLKAQPMERQLETVASAFARYGDANREAAAAQDFFSKGAVAMLPILEQLRTQGYDKLRAGVAATAGLMSNEAAAAIDEAGDAAVDAEKRLSIALANANRSMMEIKTTIVEALADNAGPLQSIGGAAAWSLVGVSAATALSAALGAKTNANAKQIAAAFSSEFANGITPIGGLMERKFGSLRPQFAALGRSLATPFGAAFAVAVSAMFIQEIERALLEAIALKYAKAEEFAGSIKGVQTAVRSASNMEAAAEAQAAAAKLLADTQGEVEKLEKLRDTLAATRPVANMPKPEFSSADREALEQRRAEVDLAIRLVKHAIARGVEIAANNKAQREATDLAFAENDELEKTRARRGALMEREQSHRYEALTADADRLEFLQQWRQQEAATFAEKIAATKNGELAADRELEKRVRLAEIDGKIAQVRQQAADAARRSREEAEREVEQLIEKMDRERRGEIGRALDTEFNKLAIDRARVESDFTRTGADKWTARLNDLAKRAAAVRAAMSEMQDSKTVAGAMGMNTESHAAELQRMQNELAQLEIDRLTMGPDPTSWVEQTASALTALREQWGTSAQQIAGTISGTIGTAVDSVADNITQALIVTGDWNAALNQVALSVGTELVRAIIAMGVRWVATQIMMATVGKTLQIASAAATAPAAALQSAIWSTPATLATIATMGGAAVAAPGFIATADAMTKALTAMPGFLEGGVAQGKQLAWLSEDGRPEYVFSAPAVENMGGIEALDELHRAALNPASPSSIREGAGLGQRNEKPIQVVVVYDDGGATAKARLESLEHNPAFRTIIKRIGRDSRGEWGIPT